MTTYTLRRDLDIPTIHANARTHRDACVDWLQEEVRIDLGNLLWAFARAEGDDVESMHGVLAYWVELQGDKERARMVRAFGRARSPDWSNVRVDAYGVMVPPGAVKKAAFDEYLKRQVLSVFDEDVRLIVRAFLNDYDLRKLKRQSGYYINLVPWLENRGFLCGDDAPPLERELGPVEGQTFVQTLCPSQFLPQQYNFPEAYHYHGPDADFTLPASGQGMLIQNHGPGTLTLVPPGDTGEQFHLSPNSVTIWPAP